MHLYPSHIIVTSQLPKEMSKHHTQVSHINKATVQVVTFIGSSLQGKCLDSLFHYTEVDSEHLDCDIKLTIYKSCKKNML